MCIPDLSNPSLPSIDDMGGCFVVMSPFYHTSVTCMDHALMLASVFGLEAMKATRKVDKQKKKVKKAPRIRKLHADPAMIKPRPLHISPACPLVVGSDCSGIMCLELALEQTSLKGKFASAFASEVDLKVRAIIKKNHVVSRLYGDSTKRDQSKTPAVHLYGTGAPCQPFSGVGVGGIVLVSCHSVFTL